MFVSDHIKNNTILALISGSFILQLFVLMVALVYRFNSPFVGASTAAALNTNVSLTETKPVSNTAINESDLIAETEKKERVISYKISSGDTLSKIWAKQSSNPTGGLKAAEAFKDANVPLTTLKLGDEVNLKISAQDDILEFSMKLPEGKSIKLTGNSVDGYKAEVIAPNIVVKERTVSYPIFDTFSESAQEVSVPVEIIDDLVDLLSSRLDFRALHPGDTFTVIYDERSTDNGERLAPGKIKAFSIETGNKLVVAIGHAGKDGKPRYFNENGEILGDSFLRYPLKFSRISSIFTKARFHPVLKTSRPHNGVDFAAPTGTPVRTIGDGIVEFAGFKKDTGNMVKIKHNDKYSTAYLHLSKISGFIKKGTHLTKGDVIGAVGSTGMSTGPHLHFAMYENEKFINPMTVNLPLISSIDNSIPKTVLASTMGILKQQHELVRVASLLRLNRAA